MYHLLNAVRPKKSKERSQLTYLQLIKSVAIDPVAAGGLALMIWEEFFARYVLANPSLP